MQEDRRLAVLRAIVEDYVSTEEPVGSKALVERHGLGVSPATVRNDMAVLEEEGYITQPHTSAGRVPTDKGYRMFVDRLTTVKPLSSAEKRAISSFLDGAVDLDDVVQRSVRLLSQLTRQVAVVQYPTLSSSTVRHVELVALTPERLLVVLILSTGRVEQRLVELSSPLADDDLATLRSRLLLVATGQRIADAVAGLRALVPARAAQAPRGGRVQRHGDRPDRRRGPLRGARLDQRGVDGLRPRGPVAGHPGHRGPDPHGLPRDDGCGTRRRPLRDPDPRRGLSRPSRTRRPADDQPQTS